MESITPRHVQESLARTFVVGYSVLAPAVKFDKRFRTWIGDWDELAFETCARSDEPSSPFQMTGGPPDSKISRHPPISLFNLTSR